MVMVKYKRMDNLARRLRPCIKEIYRNAGVNDHTVRLMRRLFGSPWAMPISPDELERWAREKAGRGARRYIADEFGVTWETAKRWVTGQSMIPLHVHEKLWPIINEEEKANV